MLISLAVDYQAADVATRERFHVPLARVPQLYARRADDGFAEIVLVATCNRTELFAWCPDAKPAALPGLYRKLARRWMPRLADANALLGIAVQRSGTDAARHAIRVAVGLESQVLGDGQILGQVRRAYAEAATHTATGPFTSRLFESALRAGKRVQANTALSSGKNSVGAQAAALCMRRFAQLTHTRVAIVGCGKTGERVARQLAKFGARDLVFMNRTEARAAELANELAGRVAPLSSVHTEVAMADIAIVATGAEAPIIRTDLLHRARLNCATERYPLLLIDLSMPRNIADGAAALGGITLIDLDALEPQLTATEQQRRSAIPAAEAIIEAELQEFNEWLAAATAREAIRPLRDALSDICREEIEFAAGEEVAAHLSKRIVAKLMARPMSAVRAAVSRGDSATELVNAMTMLFAMPNYESAPLRTNTAASIE